MQPFTELKVWKRSHALVLAIYKRTASFPAEERFGIVSQLRRAMASVPANIAEGSKRLYPRDYARFLNLAEGSLSEAQYFLILARDLGYLGSEQADAFLKESDELAPMLFALRVSVERRGKAPKQAAG